MAADDNVAHVLIDRLKSFAAAPHGNVTAFRSAAARLHSRAASQGAYVVLGCVGFVVGCSNVSGLGQAGQELAFLGYISSFHLPLSNALAIIP
jgi:hypothetical protein